MGRPRKLNPIMYAIFFKHGEGVNRIEESVEGSLNEKEEITEVGDIRALEAALVKQNFVNPKIINYIALRRKN